MDELLKVLAGFEVVDLSHTIERGMPRWPTHPQVIVDPCCTFEHDGFYNQCLVMGEHTGTHMDAPAHTVPSQPERTVDTLPPDCICGSAVVYDMRGLGLEAGDRLSLPETQGGSRSVKRLCLDHHIPLPERDRLPALYVGGALAAVWRLGVDTAFSAPEGEPCRFIQITEIEKEREHEK